MHDAPFAPRRAAAIAALAGVLWGALLAGGWELPYRAGDFVHPGESGVTLVIESNWSGSGRAELLDRPSDPKALPSADVVLFRDRTQHVAVIIASAEVFGGPAHTLPAIRAPPRPIFSV